MLLAVLAVALVAHNSLAALSVALEEATGSIARQLELSGNVKAAANGLRNGQRGILLAALQKKDAAATETTQKDYARRLATAKALLAELEQTLADPRGRELAAKLNASVDEHANCFRQISALANSGHMAEAAALRAGGRCRSGHGGDCLRSDGL